MQKRNWQRLLYAAVLIAAMVGVGMAAASTTPQNGQMTDAVTFNIGLEKVGEGFTLPLFLTHAGDGSGRIFVVEKPGTIALLENGRRGTVFLDIQDRVRSGGYEQGLLGLAFHPNYEQNGFFYVNYTNRQGDTIIERYSVSNDDPNRADPNSAKQLLFIDQPYANHNGGMVGFGPDGYLYIGMGDGGSAGDPLGAGQDKNNLLGKLLRLDVDNGDPYAIPATNPFANGGGAPEVWSYGWRNPWRFSWDRATGDMYIGDVGQNAYEEIHFEPKGSSPGLNYGWNIMEGFHCYRDANCNQSGLVLPVAEYSHADGISVTGGYVYRGQKFPRMVGHYFFADFGSSKTWALKRNDNGAWELSEIMSAQITVSSFGEDEAGELYMLDFAGGTIQQLVDRQ